MRILCLTARLPYPPNRGDRLRAFHFIEHLAQEHELTLLSFVAGAGARDYLAELRPFFQKIHLVNLPPWRSALAAGLNLWRSQPLQALYYRSRAMQKLVDSVVAAGDFDVAYVHLFRMAPYVARHSNLYRIVDLTDVISEEVARSLPYRNPFWRLIYTIERPRIVRYERWAARHFEETWLISEADRRVLAAACPGANIQVVRNGVDTEAFSPLQKSPAPHRLIFVGHFGVFHNIDAAVYLVREILPLVQADIPDCTVQLVGAKPAEAVQRLAAENEAVSVTGFVPDLNAYLNEAAVFVAPLRFAAGVQNKVLEAMAAGTPVVTSSLVNKGLSAAEERDLLVADTPAGFARQIIRLLRDPALQAELSQSGRAFVCRQYSWDHVLARMQTVAQQLG